MKLYFRDNFFSSGVTEILDEEQRAAGTLDLKSAFGSSIAVYGPGGELRAGGKFGTLSSKWRVYGSSEEELGIVKARMSLFSKKFEYDAGHRGLYEIVSPAFSRTYEILDDQGRVAAIMDRIDSWFASAAFCLENQSDMLDTYELVSVIMGVNAIQKRRQNAASSPT
ncbi:hypothetical protein [Paenibacillus gansuensis]|uniref:Uncharacterized protein n=1 Tax=Paenibacillus gansuensis TaxID=306542 RepID=A0ABW5PM33_9BACL